MARTLSKMACVIAFALSAGAALAQTPKKVVIAAGTQVLNITYPWLMMPNVLGYWQEEGLDVEVIPAGGSAQAIQQIVGGGATFGQVNSSVLIQAVVANKLPVRAVMLNTVVDWSLVALKDGSIKSLKDYRGKSIGVSSLGTGGIALLRSYLKANGLEPDKDFEIVPVGFGSMALDALRSHRVDGLMFWGSAVASFENAGTALTYFRAPEWLRYADFSLVVADAQMAKDPDMVSAVVRGAPKASLFAITNPDCARTLFWKRYPALRASGTADEATKIKWDDHNLASSLETMQQALALGGGSLWGATPAEGYDGMQRFMAETKQIDHMVPPGEFVAPPDFFKKVNDFDHAKVEQAAKACAA